MHPFDKIQSRDNAAFPFAAFQEYPRSFAVDWRAGVVDIFDDFAKAAGLAGSAQLTVDPASRTPVLSHDGQRLALGLHNATSPQHGMVSLLQGYFGIRHSIRYMNHVAPGDTAYFVVESTSTWKRLEAANPHVKWFFTPLEKLPDVFTTSFETLAECGRQYAET